MHRAMDLLTDNINTSNTPEYQMHHSTDDKKRAMIQTLSSSRQLNYSKLNHSMSPSQTPSLPHSLPSTLLHQRGEVFKSRAVSIPQCSASIRQCQSILFLICLFLVIHGSHIHMSFTKWDQIYVFTTDVNLVDDSLLNF